MRRFPTAVLILIVLGAAGWAGDPAPDASEIARASIECWQYGIPTASIVTGDSFQVRGARFAVSLPVSVCFSGSQCLHSDVDASGSFIQNRILRKPGRYLVTVRQARSRDLETWILRATLQIEVTR